MAMTGDPMTNGHEVDHAIVLGAGMAGLAAAAALAARSRVVTLIEADPLPRVDEARKGVPQGRHVHLLLPAGLAALGDLLPGVADDLRGAGAEMIDRPEDFRILLGGGRLRLETLRPGFALVGATRPLVEGVVRERVRSLPNVRVRSGVRAKRLRAGDGDAVTGVELARSGPTRAAGDAAGAARAVLPSSDPAAAGAGAIEWLEGDVVVDATGRGSRAPAWLRELGFEAPTEERVRVDLRYTTRLFRRDPAAGDGERIVLVEAPPGVSRGGVALAVEGNRWIVTLTGMLGEQPPGDLDGFLAYARSLWTPELHDIARAAEPLGPAEMGAYPANARRRFDRLPRFPGGFVVVGDALCPFNPLYAQGMSVAAFEGLALGRALDRAGAAGVGRAFFGEVRGLLQETWTQAVDGDLRHPGVEGPRTLRWRVLGAYARQVSAAAHRDPVLARALFEVMCLLAPGSSLARPAVALRAFTRRRAPRAGAGARGAPGLHPSGERAGSEP